MAGFANRFLLRLVADRAGIQENDVGIVFRVHHGVALTAEHCGDGFGVALVHLAPVGFDVDPVHREYARMGAGYALTMKKGGK